MFVPDPVVVVEVISPSSGGVDRGARFDGDFRVPLVVPYPVVLSERRTVLRHARGADDAVHRRMVNDGALALDPPGLTLDVATLFATD